MADITVSSFAEFLTAAGMAAGTYGKIICPENAVWDLNEIDPENNVQNFSINANVQGNGTSILHFKGGMITIYADKTITELNFLDFFSNASGTYDALLRCDSTNSHDNWAKLYKCRVSAQLGFSGMKATKNIQRERCSFNFSFQHPYGIQVFYATNQNKVSRYNRIKIEAPNSTGLNSGYWNEEYSEIIVDLPQGDTINNTISSCTIRGNLEHVTKVSSTTSNPISVMTGAPNFAWSSGGRIKPVTDAQMRDIAYLESIGFAIGSE